MSWHGCGSRYKTNGSGARVRSSGWRKKKVDLPRAWPISLQVAMVMWVIEMKGKGLIEDTAWLYHEMRLVVMEFMLQQHTNRPRLQVLQGKCYLRWRNRDTHFGYVTDTTTASSARCFLMKHLDTTNPLRRERPTLLCESSAQ